MKHLMLSLVACAIALTSFSQGGEVAPPPPPPPPAQPDVPPPPPMMPPVQLAEEMPVFPGCDPASDPTTKEMCFQQKLMEHVMKQVNYPEIAKDAEIQGKVIIKFVVNKEGKVEQAKVVRGVHPSLDNESLRVVKSLPDMMPAKQDGKPVDVFFHVPVKFKL